MTAVELVDKLMGSEHADVVRESVAWLVAEVMEAEVAGQIGAGLGEVSPERVTQRNGYRERSWATRAGELELRIPKLRSGRVFPELSGAAPTRRAGAGRGRARGVCQRRLHAQGRPAGRADGLHMSKDQVSRLCRGLDEQVQAFRERPLEGRYPYVWLDGKIEQVRERGGVRQKCLVIAYAVHETGRREVIGLDVGEAEPRRSGASSSDHSGPAACR